MKTIETKTVHLEEIVGDKVIELVFKTIVSSAVECKTLRTIEARHRISVGSWQNCLTIESLGGEDFKPKDVAELNVHLNKWEKGLSRKFFFAYNMLK